MCDTLRYFAATKIQFITVQKGYEFHNNVYVDGRSLFIGLLCKAFSTSAIFVFTMDALTERFMSATDPVSRDSGTERVIFDTFGAVSPGCF
ncbi:hypothetical protein TNCV_4076131 [Trichonephila clavipes]|nr:hypothetical protein TNCV_4076131 [Trichonephila clavipes]